MRRFFVFFLFATFSVLPLRAQDSSGFGFLEHGKFLGEMRKYSGDNPYAKAFTWDGSLGQSYKLFRYNREALWIGAQFQAVVAQSYDRKIRVSGQVYVLEGFYRHTFSSEWMGSWGLSHISTHVTQDILNPFYMDLPPLPDGLLGDANLLWIGVTRSGTWANDLPVRVEFILQPIDVMLPQVWDNKRYARPYYLVTDLACVHAGAWQGSLATACEFGGGRQSIGKLEARWELLVPSQKEGRFQVILQRFFYGDDIGSSPRFGFFPAEYALGFRFVFD